MSLRSFLCLALLILGSLHRAVAQDGVERPNIDLSKVVVDPIKDNDHGTIVVRNIKVTGGACNRGARPTKYSIKLEPRYSNIQDDQTRAKYNVTQVGEAWVNDSTCTITMELRGGPLPITPHAVHGMVQVAVQVYVVCIEKFTTERTKNLDLFIMNE